MEFKKKKKQKKKTRKIKEFIMPMPRRREEGGLCQVKMTFVDLTGRKGTLSYLSQFPDLL